MTLYGRKWARCNGEPAHMNGAFRVISVNGDMIFANEKADVVILYRVETVEHPARTMACWYVSAI